MQIIDLNTLVNGQTVSGFVYVMSHGTKTDESNTPLKGVVHYKGKDVTFNVWKSNVALLEIFNKNNLSGRIIYIEGTVKVSEKYGTSIDLQTVNFNTPPMDLSAFIKSVNVQAVADELWSFLTNNLSSEHMQLVQEFFQTSGTWGLFTTVWAGQKMHDAQVGGLMNHTLKMLKLALALTENDNRLAPYKSLLLLSVLLHDLGKVHELDDKGVYQPESFVSHRIIGIEMIAEHKQIFLKYISLHDYRIIVSVMQGHHGEFADKPNSVWALIVHYIDALEALTTGFLDKLDNKETEFSYGNERVWAFGEKLAF